MALPLVMTKLYIPPVRPGLVPRRRLIERLDAGLRRKLTLISAPAGSGKTTLLSEWASGCGLAVAWVSLDGNDDDPVRFLAYLVAALRTIPCLNKARVGDSILAALQAPRFVGVDTFKGADALPIGPLLRGSGVAYDVRRAEPYGIYDRFDFEVVTEDGCDVYARYLVRLGEMRQSLRILKQALDQIPEGPVQGGRQSHTLRVLAGDAYGRVESPKGEWGFYIVSDGTANPYRYHVRAPAFVNLTSLAELCRGLKIADTVVIYGSVDTCMGEVDR